MSNKQPQLLNNWLKIGSVAFGVSCGCTLPFTQNLAQSALIGLATMPGVAASVVVRSRQRQLQIDRQFERGRVRLRELQQREESLTEQLQRGSQDYQSIELRVAQLHSLTASLNDRIDRDRQQQAQLEQKLATITLYSEEQQEFATKLDRKIQEKQARNLEVDTNFNSLKLELSQLQSEQVRLESSNNRANIILGNIQAEIDRSSVIKRELEGQIRELQSQQQEAVSSVDDSIDRQRLVLDRLNLEIIDRQKVHTDKIAEVEQLEQAELERLESIIQAKLQEIEQIEATRLQSSDKQVKLAELDAEISARNNAIEQCNQELEKIQLELRDRQAEIDNLESTIQTKLQSIDEIEIDLARALQTFEPKPPIVSRSIVLNVAEGEWSDKFVDNPHLGVLQHIEKHGTITESEASSKLGNARSVRQFANKLEEYAQDLPFSIRVESSPKGNRYLKEDRN